MLIEKQFDAGDMVLNYVESEHARPPMVLLHGLTMRWQYYLPVLPALSARWHTYALDLRGHGKSGRVKDGYRLEAYAQDCVTFLKDRAREPAVLLGHSWGGMVAIEVAVTAPELVRALVLEDPPLSNALEQDELVRFTRFRDLVASGSSFDTIAARLADENPGRDPVWARRRARFFTLLDPEVLTTYVEGRAMENYDTDKLLGAVSCPVLLLRADPKQGGAIRDEEEQRALALLRDVTLVNFPGVGHPIQATKPDVFCRIVSDFLESLD